MTEEKKPNIERWQIKVLGITDKKPFESGAVKLTFQGEVKEHKYEFFTFSKRLIPTIESSVDKVINAQVEISTRETERATYIDRKVTEIFVDGQPLGGQKQGGQSGGWRGKSPEELELSRRSYALSYAKDLAMADKIKVSEIQRLAQEFNDWLISTPSPAKSTATAVKETAVPAKETPKAKPAPTKQETPSADQAKHQVAELLQWVADNMKFKSIPTARNWLVNVSKIENARIDNEPQEVMKEIAELQGWSV